MDLTGRIALQRAKDSDTSAAVLWRCAVTAETPATVAVEVRRATGGAVVKKGGALVLKAEDGTELATGGDGKVGTTLPAKTTSAGTIETWIFLVAAPPLARNVELELWAALAGGSLQKLAASAPAAVPAAAFNAGTSVLTLDESKLPRLCIGINSASPDLVPDKYGRTTMLDRPSGNPGKSSGRSADDNAALLYQLYVHLDRPSTLNPAWDQQTSPETTDISLSDAAYNATPARVAEERWARQVTEMLLLSTYGGPGVRYNQGKAFDELDLCGAGVQQSAANPVFGLSFACQHLATFGVSSRGERVLPRQINAGSYAALTVKDAGGVWLDHHDPPQEDADAHKGPPFMPEGGNTYDVTPLLVNEPDRYGPGSVHLFSNRRVRSPQDQPTYERLSRSLAERKLDWGTATVLVTRDVRGHQAELTISMSGPDHWHTRFLTYDSNFLADNQDSCHVGFVLRKGKVNGQPKMQLLDTGGFGVAGRDASLYGPGAFSGNYDDPAGTAVHGGSPFRGTGVFPLPVTKPDADRLNDHVKNVLKVARPLGIVRFALVRRGANFQLGNVKRLVKASLAGTSNDFHYISPAALMYDQDEDTQNYPIVRYLWSLRNMPNSAELQGLWLIYVPTGTLAAAMRAAGRSTTLATLVASGGGGGDASLWLAAHTAPLTVAAVNADGTLRMLGSNRGFLHPLTTLEKRQDWQENVLPMDQALAAGGAVTDAIPYFTWR